MSEEIDLIKLKKVADILFEHLISTRGMNKCRFDKDYYWDVISPNIYDPYTTPRTESTESGSLAMGSLDFDLEVLLKVLDGQQEPLAAHLTYLAAILRYLGDTLGDDLASVGG